MSWFTSDFASVLNHGSRSEIKAVLNRVRHHGSRSEIKAVLNRKCGMAHFWLSVNSLCRTEGRLATLTVMQSFLFTFIHHSDPGYWISIAIVLCVIILINPLPLSTEKEVSFISHFVMYVRRLLLIVLALLVVCIPLMIALLAYGLSQDSHYVDKVMHAVFIQKMMQHWSLLAAGIVGGIFLNCWDCVICYRCFPVGTRTAGSPYAVIAHRISVLRRQG